MPHSRRTWLASAGATAFVAARSRHTDAQVPSDNASRKAHDLRIKEVRVTPIALPDPPILAASGCHGPYFLRTVIEIVTADGIIGIGETRGGSDNLDGCRAATKAIIGQSALAWRRFADGLSSSVYAGIELACLDAIGRATGLRLCELLGGPVREDVEFAAYLFFRFAADHPALLADKRIVDARGRGAKALDNYGEVRTPDTMADLAWRFHQQFGFRVHKLKAGVLEPDVELEALKAISDRFGGKHLVRIDPNARWRMETALRIGRQLRDLPLEYYEDPVAGQRAMAEVRQKTGLKMSTNMCVTSLEHIPEAVETKPIDVVLADHHSFGGIPACQALGQIAPSLGWTLSQHSNNHAGITMAAMIHMAAVVPQLTVASDTHYPWLVDEADILVGGKLKIAGGRMQIPQSPGLGVELDRDKLAKAHETFRKCGMRERDDTYTMRLVEPGWERTLF